MTMRDAAETARLAAERQAEIEPLLPGNETKERNV
jgi:hypothetical protein